jgi:hypothetical protein
MMQLYLLTRIEQNLVTSIVTCAATCERERRVWNLARQNQCQGEKKNASRCHLLFLAREELKLEQQHNIPSDTNQETEMHTGAGCAQVKIVKK